MRIKGTLIVLSALFLAHCGPSHNQGQGRSFTPGSTGYRDAQGVEYIHGGDERVEDALNQPAPAVPTPPSAKPELRSANPQPVGNAPARPAAKILRERIKEFQISRFDDGDPAVKRQGKARFALKVFFRTEASIEFQGRFQGSGGKLTVHATANRYTLTGELTDSANSTLGKFTLRDGGTGESAEIYYRAYTARLNVRNDRTRQVAPGSTFERQLQDLRTNTFGWVHNWTVMNGNKGGPAFYLVDIVRREDPAQPAREFTAPVISFKGESKRADEQDIEAESLTPDVSRVTMLGNADNRRMFELRLQDRQSAEQNDVLVDVENIEAPEGFGPVDSNQEPIEYLTPEQPGSPRQEPRTQPTAPGTSQPEPQRDSGGQRQPPSRPDTTQRGDAYLRVDTSDARTRKMIADFERNRSIPGVRAQIANFQNREKNLLRQFYHYANPFRRMMEAVGAAYDVSPGYAYLTVIESAYFREDRNGRVYQIERPWSQNGRIVRDGRRVLSTALGPFQILDETAEGLGLSVTNRADDERRFFAPGSCAAAKYVGQMVNEFDDSDSTLAILAYFQGEGGARATQHCLFGNGVGDRSSCANSVNRGMSGDTMSRYRRLAKNYNYTYLEMARMSALPTRMRDYVNRKLAIYFISSDMARYGFSVPSNAPRDLPSNGTVFPTREIRDAKCRSVIATLR